MSKSTHRPETVKKTFKVIIPPSRIPIASASITKGTHSNLYVPSCIKANNVNEVNTGESTYLRVTDNRANVVEHGHPRAICVNSFPDLLLLHQIWDNVGTTEDFTEGNKDMFQYYSQPDLMAEMNEHYNRWRVMRTTVKYHFLGSQKAEGSGAKYAFGVNKMWNGYSQEGVVSGSTTARMEIEGNPSIMYWNVQSGTSTPIVRMDSYYNNATDYVGGESAITNVDILNHKPWMRKDYCQGGGWRILGDPTLGTPASLVCTWDRMTHYFDPKVADQGLVAKALYDNTVATGAPLDGEGLVTTIMPTVGAEKAVYFEPYCVNMQAGGLSGLSGDTAAEDCRFWTEVYMTVEFSEPNHTTAFQDEHVYTRQDLTLLDLPGRLPNELATFAQNFVQSGTTTTGDGGNANGHKHAF